MTRIGIVCLLLLGSIASISSATPARDARAIAAVRAHVDSTWQVHVDPVPMSGDSKAKITSKLIRVQATKTNAFGRKTVHDHFLAIEGKQLVWIGKEPHGLLFQASKRTPVHELLGMLKSTKKLGAATTMLLTSGIAGAATSYLDLSVNHAAVPEWAKLGAVAVVGGQRLWNIWSDARTVQDASRKAAVLTTISERKSNDPRKVWATYLNVMKRDHEGTSPMGLGCFYDQLVMRDL